MAGPGRRAPGLLPTELRATGTLVTPQDQRSDALGSFFTLTRTDVGHHQAGSRGFWPDCFPLVSGFVLSPAIDKAHPLQT